MSMLVIRVFFLIGRLIHYGRPEINFADSKKNFTFAQPKGESSTTEIISPQTRRKAAYLGGVFNLDAVLIFFVDFEAFYE